MTGPVLDVFPAIVRLGESFVTERARARVFPDRLEVWTDSSTGPMLLVSSERLPGADLAPGYAPASKTSTVPTEAGVFTVARGPWCGCGSSLRGSLDGGPQIAAAAAVEATMYGEP